MFVAKLGSVSTGTEDVSNAGEFTIFPNPGSGQFSLKADGVIHSVEVYSISGEKIYSRANINQQLFEKINLSALPPGIYIIKANVSDRQYLRKLIIQNTR